MEAVKIVQETEAKVEVPPVSKTAKAMDTFIADKLVSSGIPSSISSEISLPKPKANMPKKEVVLNRSLENEIINDT